MFFPEEMTEVELIVPSKDLLAVTKVLGNKGVFHQLDSTYLGLENLGPSTWTEKAAAYSTLERRIQVIMQNLHLKEEYSGATDFDTPADLEPLQSAVDRIEADVKKTSDELSAEKKRLEQFESQLHQLEPIAETNVDVGALRKSHHLHSVLGIIPAENVSRLQTSLSRVPHAFFTLREDPKKPVVWLLGPRSNSDIIDRAAKSAYLNPLSLPEEFAGTPAEITASLRKAIATSKQKIGELERKLSELANTHKKELQKLLWDVHVSRRISDAIARFGQLRHTYVVVGWVPSSELESLTQRLKQASKEILIEAHPMERSEHQSNVPVALRNPGALSPFEVLVNTYARPRYEEIDPTALIALTFPLLYGAMFGDVGHGLVLAAIGWFLSRRSTLGGLLVACGLSGMIFGFLYGSIFGFEEILPHHPFFGQFFWLSPIHDVLAILRLAIGAGIVLLILAHLLNLYNAARSGNWGRFFFDSNGLAGLILYLSFLVLLGYVASILFTGESFIPGILITIGQNAMVVTIAQILFVVGLFLATIFSHPLQHWMETGHFEVEGGWGMFAIQSLAEVLEKFISMLSNTLSYVRVGAFAIVHAGFTGAVFVIARLLGEEGSFAYWTTVVLGNLFVIGLEGFIVTIQTMRLHYYEFFSKFFRGGGSAYEPLTLAASQEK
jgi:V/A-type H+/Na+-transporting ATPase subunit I